MRTHVINRLVEKARENNKIVLLVGDLGFHVVEDFQCEFPDRFINCGIAEQNMMAVASGMAKEGDIVFVYSIGNFPTLRCLEQIRNDVCYHHVNVNIISVGGGFSYGTLGMSHHTTEELAILRALPGIKVYAPADFHEAVSVLDDVIGDPSPTYMRLARGSDQEFYDESFNGNIQKLIPYDVKWDEQVDVSIVSSGPILEEAINVQNVLNSYGIRTNLFSSPAVKPLDEEGLIRIGKKSRLIISIEEHNVLGGLGGAVAEVLAGQNQHAPLLRFGLPDVYSGEVGSREYLRKYYGIDAESIVKKTVERMNYL